VIGSAAVAARRLSYRDVRVTCAIISMVVSGSLPMTDPNHGSVGMKDRDVPVVAEMKECII
jgi:hypothetical protein